MQAVGLQLLLVGIGAILAAAIRMEKAAWRRIAEAHCHIERPDCQILLHSVTDRPAHNAAAMQIEDDGEVEPALRRPDIGDIASPLLVGRSSNKITVQPVRRNAQSPHQYRNRQELAALPAKGQSFAAGYCATALRSPAAP